MKNVVVIAKNEEACKLLDCLAAYKKLISVNHSDSGGNTPAVEVIGVSDADHSGTDAIRVKV